VFDPWVPASTRAKPFVGVDSVTAASARIAATATSLGWLVTAVVPESAVVPTLDPLEFVAVLSTAPDDAAPDHSVRSMIHVPVNESEKLTGPDSDAAPGAAKIAEPVVVVTRLQPAGGVIAPPPPQATAATSRSPPAVVCGHGSVGFALFPFASACCMRVGAVACETVNASTLVAVPPGVVTEIWPVLAATGTTVWIVVSSPTVYGAVAPAKVTDEAFAKPVPVIVTRSPGLPLVGANDEIVGEGGGSTVKSVALKAVPPPVLTEMGPVVADSGTVALIVVSFGIEKVADAPWKRTAYALVNPVPVIVTVRPARSAAGEKLKIVGVGNGVGRGIGNGVAVAAPPRSGDTPK
jgi:hypothetical protein